MCFSYNKMLIVLETNLIFNISSKTFPAISDITYVCGSFIPTVAYLATFVNKRTYKNVL